MTNPPYQPRDCHTPNSKVFSGIESAASVSEVAAAMVGLETSVAGTTELDTCSGKGVWSTITGGEEEGSSLEGPEVARGKTIRMPVVPLEKIGRRIDRSLRWRISRSLWRKIS